MLSTSLVIVVAFRLNSLLLPDSRDQWIAEAIGTDIRSQTLFRDRRLHRDGTVDHIGTGSDMIVGAFVDR